ncbi:tyrosine-type recombinase/integrase [Aminiphilus circumscriptus]|uniref:tyrosine-type recombinase/integrase n=1 Tax=Aminiphilus circumscriptus TaxID=290732 RepID=UPI003B84B4DB
MEKSRTHGHVRTVTSRLDRLILPFIGKKPVADIVTGGILSLAKKEEAAGRIETAHRVMQICGQIMRYAVATGRTDMDPTSSLKESLVSGNPEHFPTMTNPEQIGGLLRVIDSLNGSPIVCCAVKLQILTFVRPGELRLAEWSEISKTEWKIPPERMKMRRPHIVPLSAQALAVLDELRPVTNSKSRYLFPSIRDFRRPMSDMTINAALRRMGYSQQELTGHSFRSMASTILNGNGWPPDVIERQLVHIERNTVRAAYNHAEHLEKRREMMQWWGAWFEDQMGK